MPRKVRILCVGPDAYTLTHPQGPPTHLSFRAGGDACTKGNLIAYLSRLGMPSDAIERCLASVEASGYVDFEI